MHIGTMTNLQDYTVVVHTFIGKLTYKPDQAQQENTDELLA